MLCLVCAVASTHAVIRFAQAAHLQQLALWLLLVCSPLAIMPGFYPSPTHALEHALLINALACQASGRRATSLALATVCLFVKPTLASCYGPILVVVILFGVRPTPTPAAIVGIATGSLLAVEFGLEPLWATLLPIDEARFYAAQNFGFFGGQLSSGPIRNEATVGLMASGEDQKSWAHVRAIAATDRVLVLVPVSACRVMMPELDSPKCWYLLKPIARPAEFDRVNAQIRAANWLVIPTGPGERLDTWPEFADSIAPFRVVETHSTFLLARRMEPRATKR